MIQTTSQRLSNWFRDEFRSEKLIPSMTSGVVFGLTEVIFALSLGSLIFSGKLAPYLPYGIGMALATAAIIMIGTSLTSSIPGVIGSTQDSSSVILAVIASSLAGSLVALRSEDILVTVLVAIATATLLTGAFFLTLGFFKLGKLVRFIPYPVVGGFLAGTGWLLLQGSFSVMSDFSLTFQNLAALLRPDQLISWIPGVLFALVLHFGSQKIKHFLALPGIMVASIVVFYLVLLLSGMSIQEATESGLLLGQVSGEAIWQPLALKTLLAADWAAIFGQSGNIAIVLILSVVSLLLNASALELTTSQDIQLNHELQSSGIANLLSGLGGGMVGYHALSLTTLSHRMGARGRLPGLLAGAISAGMLFAGSALLAYFPKPILGGLLFFLGLVFLVDWVVVGWRKLSRADYAIVLLIMVVIAVKGFLFGVGIGLVAAVILFVVNYSRINIVHHALSGAEMRSNVERCTYHQRVLANELGKHIYILELQGFIFFGTANALLDQIRSRVGDSSQPPVRYILLDFRRVNGLDSSAVISFVKGKQLAEAQKITLVLTHLTESMQRRLELDGLSESDPGVCIFPDLDRGLEWCEEQLLEANRVTILHMPITLSAQLADNGFAKTDTTRLKAFLERVEFKEGDVLIRQGEEADKLYFIEMGTVSVFLDIENGKRVRLQTLGFGTAVGEPGLYLGQPCTASVVADSPVCAYRLTRAALSEMKRQEPELAATFHEFAARLLSERLTATTRTLDAMLH